MRWWQGQHDFMLAGPYHRPSYIHCDGTAQTMLRVILRAIADWPEAREAEKPLKPPNRWFLVKIGFAFSDILRNGSSIMRQVQFAETMNGHLSFDTSRAAIAPMEIMSAFHKYLRELELHAGYYRSMERLDTSGTDGLDGKASKANNLVALLQRQDPPTQQGEGLDLPVKLKRVLIQTAKSLTQPFATSDVRTKIRDRTPWRSSKQSDLGIDLATAAETLTKEGLLEEVAEVDRTKMRGPRRVMTHYKVMEWTALSAEALKVCEDLKLSRDDFP